jgi:hypothetical protein
MPGGAVGFILVFSAETSALPAADHVEGLETNAPEGVKTAHVPTVPPAPAVVFVDRQELRR